MRKLPIAYGNSRHAKKWTNKEAGFDSIKERLRVPIRTTESVEEYARMTRDDRANAKDHGGFVLGALIGGRRKMDAVASRSGLCFDGDRVTQEFLDGFEAGCPYQAVLYSTHSHTPAAPRIRIAMPAARDMTPEEFVAVSRYVAQELGIDQFDECSYLPNQMMYYPSVPSNGDFLFKETPDDRPWVDPDALLAAHPEWHDPTRLPTSSRESRANAVSRKKVQDPLEKKGVIGAFNRAFFPISLALERFLADVYEPSEGENRWRLKSSASVAGVEVIGDKFIYSHHATDPAYMRLCNAFDAVRLHLFGDGEDSGGAMREFAAKQPEVRALLMAEKAAEAEADVPGDWTALLEFDQHGSLRNTLKNLRLIMENDPALSGIVFNQLADGLEIRGDVPWDHPAKFWRDQDDAQLVCYIDERYGSFSQRNFDIAVTKAADDRRYHPIREYFEALPPWDGVPRVDTLLADYLGAADNPYTRAVIRKVLCAAYTRVYHPGTKFDYMPVLNGDQGIGKSTFIARLGMEWFSDSLSLSDMNDKTAAEKLQGYWVHEIGELAGMKKADLDKVKAFISRQDDKYRASFGRRVTPHPRQCVFFGTTNNENGYLRDITGNRRYWNVKVTGKGPRRPWDMTREVVDQIWAEVKELEGEPLFLPPELEAYAQGEQRQAMERDDREGLVLAYLEMLLPDGWEEMDIFQRRDYVQGDPTAPKGTRRREMVCNMEIWCECLGQQKEKMRPSDSYAIASIMARIEGWEKLGRPVTLPVYGKQRVYRRTTTKPDAD